MKTAITTIVLTFLMQLNGFSQNCSFKIWGFNQDFNVAFLGVNNSIDFEKLLDTTISIEFETKNGVIFSDRYGYKYRPSFLGKSAIKLYHIIDGVKSLIDSCEIEIKYLPFTLEIGNHSTYFTDTIEMERDEFLKGYFAVLSTNTNLSAIAKILEFELVVLRDDKTIFTSKYYEYDRDIDIQIKNNLQILQSNDKVFINQLMYRYEKNHETKHRNVVVKIR